jgi:predicted GNAT family acetyltransferase
MKPLAKISGGSSAMRSPQTRNIQRIQQHGAHSCRTNTCAVNSVGQQKGPGQSHQNVTQMHGVGQRPGGNALPQRVTVGSRVASQTPNYRVQTPIPLGRGSQQIRATIHGTPQVAGSVEMSTAGAGKVYISNLRVEQQHRRQGVAAKLIDAAISTARRQGFRAVTLEARPSDNGISPQALVAMYRRQGFRSVGKSGRGSPMMERKL